MTNKVLVPEAVEQVLIGNSDAIKHLFDAQLDILGVLSDIANRLEKLEGNKQ